MKKNDFFELQVTSTTLKGYGVAHIDGYAVFVKNACKGDKVNAKIIKVTKSYAVAIIDTVLQPSADRTADDCPISGKCGSCTFGHVSYQAECALKEAHINDAFSHIGGLDLKISAFHGTSRYGYRNKAVYPVSTSKDGGIISGFYAEKSHRIVEHDFCAISNGNFAKIRSDTVGFAEENGISAYDEAESSGILRGIYLRSAKDGSIILTLVVNGKIYGSEQIEKRFCEFILSKHPYICSILVNINQKKTNVVLGEKWRVLYGDGYLYDVLCGKKFRISPASFYQVNRGGAEILYGIAKKYAGLSGGEKLLDLYCGTGTVGICIAEKDTRLFGVDIVQSAVDDASFNASQNGINARFFRIDAQKSLDDGRLADILPDVITIDPPRKGCGIESARKIASFGAKRIVYISCDPATLARDLAEFEKCGYVSVCAEAVDMFPRTGHVETVVLMSRVER
ncbi:MAG: 23S rRNA (uracil(1939)-C(5))-methyltransferase RlmD [Clostridiales bacterium]|nr:23S rRNA (uracil(1939)-C(5))-methyltransferase RlmD [Clostridiales bacterium]